MAVVRRGDVWQVQVRIGKDPRTGKWIRRSATCDTKAEAQRVERRLLAEAEANRASWVEPTKLTVEQYLIEWLERKRAEGRTSSTLFHYGDLVKRLIVPAFGKLQLSDLGPAVIQRWQDGLAPSTDAPGASQAAYAHRVLRSALSDAVRLGLLPRNPAQAARPARRTPRKRGGVSIDQAQALFAATEARWAPLFRFLYYTGLRPGEALALRWGDLDMEAGILSVSRSRVLVGPDMVEGAPKTAAGIRTFALPAPARDALRAQWAIQAQDRLAAGPDWRNEEWVFSSRIGGALDLNNVNRAYRRARKAADIPADLPLYSLRHGAASVLLGSGVPLGVAAKLMGHSQVAIFADTYASLLLEASQEAARRVEEFVADRAEKTGTDLRQERPRRVR